MSYTYHGTNGWIKQPNRIVKTFPSGLCMIQQDYIRRKDLVDYSSFLQGQRIPDADAKPCIDGAFIFPEPQYQDTGDGFVKCTVTAYGRVNKTGSVTLRKVPVYIYLTLSERKTGIDFENGQFICRSEIVSQLGWPAGGYVRYPYGGTPEDGLIDYPTLKIVLPSDESPSTIPPTNLINLYVAETGENITNKTFTPAIFGFFDYNSIGNFEGKKLTVELVIDRIETTDFGRFQEYSISWRHIGSPSADFGEFVEKGSWSPFYPSVSITTSSVTTAGFTFTAGASDAVEAGFRCVDPLLDVTQTIVTIEQGATVITSFDVPTAKVGPITLTALTSGLQYEINAIVKNQYVTGGDRKLVTLP